MAKSQKHKTALAKSQKSNVVTSTPRSLAVFAGGIRSDKEFINGMAAMMADLIEGSVTPAVANSVCKAGGNMLKAIELKYRYGRRADDPGNEKTLQLASA